MTTTHKATKAIEMAKEMEEKFSEYMNKPMYDSSSELDEEEMRINSEWRKIALIALKSTPPFSLNIPIDEFVRLMKKVSNEEEVLTLKEVSLLCNAIDAVPFNYYGLSEQEYHLFMDRTIILIENLQNTVKEIRENIKEELTKNPLKSS